MTEISETYYVALRKKDAKVVVEGTVDETCSQCGDTVVIDKKLYDMAGEMKGIVCVPCVCEATGLTLGELFAMNHEHIMKLLIERFGDVNGPGR